MRSNDTAATTSRRPNSAHGARFGDFIPQLWTALRAGYGLAQLRGDAVAGLTVAIVALPLSMAIAIASGVSPERGLYTAIIGGFLVSALGGSRFQIGGPAGAFIVVVAATVAQHGLEGLLLATAMSGVFLLGIGALRLGSYIQYIPYPVTIGFTSGIAIIILASQLHDLFGLTLSGVEPGELLPKLQALADAAGTANLSAIAVAGFTIAVILAMRHWLPRWPGLLLAVTLAAVAVPLLGLDVETIGSRFGAIPSMLPAPKLPALDWTLARAVLPDAIAFTLLGAIESLLSAVVADGMTGQRHRSNGELVAQGVANLGSALFGGICVTGTIARTATNVRAGSHGPVSGMLHAVYLLLFMLIAAPLAGYIPLAALAGVLAVVAWNMIEQHAIGALLRSSIGDAVVLTVTFLLVIFRDLTEGILVGFALGSLLFLHRMAHAIAIEPEPDDPQPEPSAPAAETTTLSGSDQDTVVYRISGAFFFAAAATVGAVLDRIADRRRNFVLDFSGVPLLDSSAAHVVEGVVHKSERAGIRVYIAGASRQVRRMLILHGVKRPRVRYVTNVSRALRQIDERKAEAARETTPPQ